MMPMIIFKNLFRCFYQQIIRYFSHLFSSNHIATFIICNNRLLTASQLKQTRSRPGAKLTRTLSKGLRSAARCLPDFINFSAEKIWQSPGIDFDGFVIIHSKLIEMDLPVFY